MIDHANEVFLDSSDQNGTKANVYRQSQSINQQQDSDEDDALLTQALNEHQETTFARSQSQAAPRVSPPAKKVSFLNRHLL